jgi:WD40 repeat protein
LATADSRWVVRIWELPAGEFVRSLPPAPDRINALLWCDEGVLALASGDAAFVWDVDRGRIRHEWTKHENTVEGFAWSAAGSLLATFSHDHTVRLWSLETGAEQAVLMGHTQRPVAATFSADGRTLVTAGEQGIIHVWDITTAQEVLTLNDFTVEWVRDIEFRDPQTLIATGSNGPELWMATWQASTKD